MTKNAKELIFLIIQMKKLIISSLQDMQEQMIILVIMFIFHLHLITSQGYELIYTQCTLKLRPVKLLFVIFGHLSYSFFANLMFWGNGRLSYLI